MQHHAQKPLVCTVWTGCNIVQHIGSCHFRCGKGRLYRQELVDVKSPTVKQHDQTVFNSLNQTVTTLCSARNIT